MSTYTVDYDASAPTYDGRYAAGNMGGVAQALTTLIERQQARRILEAGCGTGHWLSHLRTQVQQVVGLDLSPGMLKQAQRGDLRLLACGQAAQLPFPAQLFDVIFAVNAVHHFPDPQLFVAEAHRLLKPGGTLAIIGMDPCRPQNRSYVYEYFAGTYEADLQRFPSAGKLVDWMTAAGFHRIDWRVAEHIHDWLVGREVLESHFLGKGGTSQLALLTEEAYRQGLERIRAAIAEAERDEVEIIFKVDIDLAMIMGTA
jgi:ubiquinone/menaquinone biosynthesis C-methylase UbiE